MPPAYLNPRRKRETSMNLIDALLPEATPEQIQHRQEQIFARYRYGMRLREIGIGCQPANHVFYEESNKAKTGYYGILYYASPLPEDDLIRYQLTLLP